MAPEEILHMTIDSLIKTNEQQARQIEEMSVRIKELTAQLAWFQRRMFGRSSEKRMMLDGQLTLFDNTEECPSSTSMEEDGTGEKNERAVISRQGRHRSRENWENLPVMETVVHEPENVDLERYRRIGEEITYVVEHKPGKLYRVAMYVPNMVLLIPQKLSRGARVYLLPPCLCSPYIKAFPEQVFWPKSSCRNMNTTCRSTARSSSWRIWA